MPRSDRGVLRMRSSAQRSWSTSAIIRQRCRCSMTSSRPSATARSRRCWRRSCSSTSSSVSALSWLVHEGRADPVSDRLPTVSLQLSTDLPLSTLYPHRPTLLPQVAAAAGVFVTPAASFISPSNLRSGSPPADNGSTPLNFISSPSFLPLVVAVDASAKPVVSFNPSAGSPQGPSSLNKPLKLIGKA